jgi:hypothetical protein
MNQQTYLELQELYAFTDRVMKSDKLKDYEKYDHLFYSGTFRLVGQKVEELVYPDRSGDLSNWWTRFSSEMEKLDSIAPFPT